MGMKSKILHEGAGRTKVSLSIHWIGKDPVVSIFNEAGHLGAVALADYDHENDRASTSVLTRLGHKEDSISRGAAYKLCKRYKKPVCAVAGIHLDKITDEEIEQIIQNCDALVDKLGNPWADCE
jgi:hypothetical protein